MMPPYESASSVPVGIQRLNHLIQWAAQHYLDNPEYKHLWLRLDGKPLEYRRLVLLDQRAGGVLRGSSENHRSSCCSRMDGALDGDAASGFTR